MSYKENIYQPNDYSRRQPHLQFIVSLAKTHWIFTTKSDAQREIIKNPTYRHLSYILANWRKQVRFMLSLSQKVNPNGIFRKYQRWFEDTPILIV